MRMPKSQPVQPTPAAPMPDPMSPAIMEAKKRASQMQMARAGRAATILSDGNSGGDFGSKTLG